MKRAWWILMMVLALGVALYAVTLFISPAARPDFLATSPVPFALLAHFSGSAVAMAVGPFQFLVSWRARRPTLHRWMGRAYAGGILVGGLAGLRMSFFSQGGVVAHVGFGLLAILWLATTTTAVVSILNGDIRTHQRWMTRSFALTLAAVTLRIYLPAALVSGIAFDAAYPVIAWACWVPNLIAAEWFLGARRAPRALSAV
ncbi:MAG: DUF2306 domain-containing protein [Vicinamibacterales bacterium]